MNKNSQSDFDCIVVNMCRLYVIVLLCVWAIKFKLLFIPYALIPFFFVCFSNDYHRLQQRSKLFPLLMSCYRILTNPCWLTFMQPGDLLSYLFFKISVCTLPLHYWKRMPWMEIACNHLNSKTDTMQTILYIYICMYVCMESLDWN